jgi:4-amino-4-deoxy-L-arabinose transferase-like glycosyltransferase
VDEQQYVQIATNMIEGRGFSNAASNAPVHRTSARPPLYAGLVAAIFEVAGKDNLQAVRFVQILLSLATTGLVFLLGRRAFNPAVGRYAAGLVWMYPTLIFFNFTILTETLFTLLLVLFVLLLVKLVEEPTTGLAAAVGLALGFAALARSVMWPLPFALCPLLLFLLKGPVRTRVALSALVLAGYCVPVVPWAVRNTRVQGTITIIDSMDFQHLRFGNQENTPDERMWAGAHTTGGADDLPPKVTLAPGQRLSDGLKDHQALRDAVGFVTAHPWTTIRRSLIKFSDLWGLEREFVGGIEWGIYDLPSWFALVASVLIGGAYAVAALMGAAGIWLAAPERRVQIAMLLPVLSITAAHTLAFGHSRYHIPLMPLFILYGTALASMAGRVSWRQYRPALIAGATIAVVVLLSIWIRQIALVDTSRLRTFFTHVA